MKFQTGEIVTFSYESYSSRALPVNPQITRIRLDKNWKDLVNEYHLEKENTIKSIFYYLIYKLFIIYF